MNICPNCGCENKESNKFCNQCGTKLDKRYKIGAILKKYFSYSYDSFENMGDCKKNLLIFDGSLDFDAVVGLYYNYTYPLTISYKEGLLFTLSGVYERWTFSGSQYIRYSDIRTMEVEEKKDGALIINNGEFRISGAFVDAYVLKKVLKEICEINNKETSFTEVINSGKRKGIMSAATRKYGYERELLAYQRCSREYEIKLRRQADLFLQTTNAWKKKLGEYEALLDEYEKTIQELEEAIAQTNSPEYKARLENVSEYRDRLASLKD